MTQSAQKTRWQNQSDRRLAWAEAAEARAAVLLEPRAAHARDWAWNSQPGHFPQRAREIAQADRGHALLLKAKAHREKAANLQRLATTNRGDAEAARQTVRDSKTLQVGDAARSVHYGACTIVKVNTKSYRIRLTSGFETTQDKSFVS